MMFLDPEEVIKRIAIVLGCVTLAGGVGYTTWYNFNLKDEFVEGKTETNNLRDETSRLGAETDGLKTEIINSNKELKNNINYGLEETRKVNVEVKQQSITFKQYQQEIDKFRADTKQEFNKLREANTSLSNQLKEKELALIEQININDATHKKSQKELSDQFKLKDKEIQDLKSKLDKEAEWRNKNFWNR